MNYNMSYYFCTASNVKARHQLLLDAIGGVFDEEEQTYLRVTKFSWILPTIILCGGLIDLLLIVFYMKFAHPWKDILVGENTSDDAKAPEKVDQVNDDISVNMTENEDIEIKEDSQGLNQGYNISYINSIRYKILVICTTSIRGIHQ